MLITKDVLISDVFLRLTQSKPSGDLELERQQVAFVLDHVRWKLVTDKINQQLMVKYPIDPVYIITDENIAPTLVNVNGAPKQNKIQIGLQYAPLNLYRDRGVIRVFAVPVQSSLPNPDLQTIIDYGSPVDMVSAADLDTLSSLKFSKPSLGNLKYRREGKTLWLYGLDSDTYKMVTFTVTYFPRISILEDLNDDDAVPLTEDLYDPLLEATTEKIRIELYGSGSDIKTDSTQNLGSLNKQ